MSDELPDLDPELAEALEAERGAPPLSAEHHARLWSRLEASIGGGGDDGGGTNAGDDGGAAPAPSGTPSGTIGSTLGWAAAAFVAGVGIGALGYAALAPAEHATHHEAAPRLAAPAPAPHDAPARARDAGAAEARVASAGVAPEAALPDAGPHNAPRRGERVIDDEAAALRRERAVIETARSALARGDAARALEWAERHRRSFATGVMSEEREVVAIQAMAALGRMDEARARAARFSSAHPGSFFEPTIRAALRPRDDSSTTPPTSGQ